jgi:hypothetical protein
MLPHHSAPRKHNRAAFVADQPVMAQLGVFPVELMKAPLAAFEQHSESLG